MGLFDIIKSKFDGFFKIPVDECLEYHKAIRAAPHSQVTPVQVGRFLVHSKKKISNSQYFPKGIINDIRTIISHTTRRNW